MPNGTMVGPAPLSINTRFAPSSTGHLHLGHVHAALSAWRRARAASGRFLLRIEDIDTARCRPAFDRAILQDLAWLGFDWDGPVRRQSEHIGDYAAALDMLRQHGLLYPCFCSRADIVRANTAPHGPDGPVYPGTCRAVPPAERMARIAAGQPHAWRLDTVAALARTGPLTFAEAGQGRLACDPLAFGDVVLGRRDSPASYHLCVTHDDVCQGVTLVTRGCDLRPATSVHRLLQAVMGWPEPSYAHHDLLADAAGRRLAKRDGAVEIRLLREMGHTPQQVFAMTQAAPRCS